VTLRVRDGRWGLRDGKRVKSRGEPTFTVVARNLSKENKYVKQVTLNGKPVTDWKIYHSDIMCGGELVFEMCATPQTKD
jgi:putative alpha-1,2-mannosidase